MDREEQDAGVVDTDHAGVGLLVFSLDIAEGVADGAVGLATGVLPGALGALGAHGGVLPDGAVQAAAGDFGQAGAGFADDAVVHAP